MNPVHLITDSTADLSRQYYDENNIICLPYTYIIDGQPYSDVPGQTDLSAYYQSIREGALPSTTNINHAAIFEAVSPLMAQGEDVLYICFSSALTSTYQFAVACAEEVNAQYPDQHFYVVDSRSAAIGQGIVIRHAAKLKAEGYSARQIAEALPSYIQTVEHWFMVDSLDHLRRGGRISGASAAVGKMLKIKPILHIDEKGALIPTAKINGRKKGMRFLVQKLVERAVSPEQQTVYITHADCLEDALHLKKMIEAELSVKNVEIVPIGAVVGAHTGGGLLAVVFEGQSRS